MLVWSQLLVLAGKKLTSELTSYIFKYWPLPPYVHLASTHVMNAPRPSLLFVALLLLCVIVQTEGKNKMSRTATDSPTCPRNAKCTASEYLGMS